MRYLLLLTAFVRAGFIADLQYRANIIAQILTDLCWYLAHIALFEVLYRHTPTLGSWSIEDMRIFFGVLFLADAIQMILTSEGLNQFGTLVVSGNLDLLLAKPVNSQFMVSCQKISSSYIINALVVLAWLTFSLVDRTGEFSPLLLAISIYVSTAGAVILYGFRFSFAAFALIFVQSDNLQYVFYTLFRLASRPYSIYPRTFKIILMTVIPLAFIAGIPAEILISWPAPGKLIILSLAALLTLLLSTCLWRIAVRRYSSASS